MPGLKRQKLLCLRSYETSKTAACMLHRLQAVFCVCTTACGMMDWQLAGIRNAPCARLPAVELKSSSATARKTTNLLLIASTCGSRAWLCGFWLCTLPSVLCSGAASPEVKKPSGSGSSRTAHCKAGSISCTDGVRSRRKAVPQLEHQAGIAGPEASEALSSHAHSSPSSVELNQLLPVSVHQSSLMQSLQPTESRTGRDPAAVGGQKAQSDAKAVRKPGVGLALAGRKATQNAASLEGSPCPCLQDVVGIAMGCDLRKQGQSAKHLTGDAQCMAGTQKISTVGWPKVRGSFTKGPSSAVQPVDQQLQCTAQGFQGMHAQDMTNSSRYHGGKAGRDTQAASMQQARRQACKVRCNTVWEAKAACSDEPEAQTTPAFEAAGVGCSFLQ